MGLGLEILFDEFLVELQINETIYFLHYIVQYII
jgi:hypothetical protein